MDLGVPLLPASRSLFLKKAATPCPSPRHKTGKPHQKRATPQPAFSIRINNLPPVSRFLARSSHRGRQEYLTMTLAGPEAA